MKRFLLSSISIILICITINYLPVQAAGFYISSKGSNVDTYDGSTFYCSGFTNTSEYADEIYVGIKNLVNGAWYSEDWHYKSGLTVDAWSVVNWGYGANVEVYGEHGATSGSYSITEYSYDCTF